MLTYDQAYEIISHLKKIDETEETTLDEACTKTLAEPVFAQISSPPFTNSAVDGYAFASQGAKEILTVMATRYATSNPSLVPYQSQSAVAIMTGALLPDWCDSVVPIENTKLITKDTVLLTHPWQPGDNIRKAGSDIKIGECILKKNTVLNPESILLAANFGVKTLLTYKKPLVALFSTGDELVLPGSSLLPGQIYNSTMPYLKAALENLNLTIVANENLPDEENFVKNKIEQLVRKIENNHLLLITTGAVSAGEKDFIPSLAKSCGFRPLFHKLAIRPAKPIFLAIKDKIVWLGLPGNSISSVVGYNFIARPILAFWARMAYPQLHTASLASDVRKPMHLRCFYRATVNGGNAIVHSDQGSANLKASLTANAYAILPEGREILPANSNIQVLMMNN